MASFGFSSVAVRSAYASPILNLILGFSLSFVYTLISSGFAVTSLEIPPSISLLTLLMIVVTVATCCVVPHCGFEVRRLYGLGLCATWLVGVLSCLLVEGFR